MTRTTDCCSCFRPERMYRTIANMIFTSVFEEEELRHQFAVLALNKTNLLNLDLPSPDKITELEKALDVVYSSEIFRKLSDPATGLYKEGPAYVYSFLKDELGKGKI